MYLILHITFHYHFSPLFLTFHWVVFLSCQWNTNL